MKFYTLKTFPFIIVLFNCNSYIKAELPSSNCINSFGKTCVCNETEIITTSLTSLTSSMALLQANMDNLIKLFNSTRDQVDVSAAGQIMPNNASSIMAAAETLINTTQTQFIGMVATMNTEMTRIQQELNIGRENLTYCENLRPSPNQNYSDKPYVTHYCGFEDWRLCNYTQGGCYNKLAECWYRGSGRQNTRSGPVEDHTFGTPHGHYLYIDPMKQPFYVSSPLDEEKLDDHRNRTASLLTTVLPPGDQYCVRFWYTMYGHYTNTLTVYVQDPDRFSLKLTEVFQISGEVDKYWHMAEIPLRAEETSKPFKIVIKANTNSFRHSYVYHAYDYTSIDDLYIYNTSCQSIPKCPQGANFFGDGHQTSCYTFHRFPVTWYDAVKTCKSESPDGHLVSIGSKQEEDFLHYFLNQDKSMPPLSWYTSGNDERNPGNFKWTNTGYPESLNYTNWFPGQPDDVNNTQQCLVLKNNGTGYQWHDEDCDMKHSFICELRAS